MKHIGLLFFLLCFGCPTQLEVEDLGEGGHLPIDAAPNGTDDEISNRPDLADAGHRDRFDSMDSGTETPNAVSNGDAGQVMLPKFDAGTQAAVTVDAGTTEPNATPNGSDAGGNGESNPGWEWAPARAALTFTTVWRLVA